MPVPSVGYAQVATNVVQLKAITAVNRTSNYCLFIPDIGSWVYYDSSSTATADDTHIFLPNDGVGRWLVTNRLPYFAAAANAASNEIASHNAAADPHTQYCRRDGVLTANQPNSATPAYTARVITGNGSNAGGFQVLTASGNLPAVSLGADASNRGVITAGSNGLVIGGNTNERIAFWGGNAVTRPNAIALPGANTTDMRRAINELVAMARAIGVIAP